MPIEIEDAKLRQSMIRAVKVLNEAGFSSVEIAAIMHLPESVVRSMGEQ